MTLVPDQMSASPPEEIRGRLDAPVEVVDVDGLRQRWHRQIARWRLEGFAPLAQDPALIGRIRGAFGERLTQSASAAALAGKACTFDPPSAFEAIWRKQGRLSAGFDHASPWVIEVDPHEGDLVVSFHVFGFAVEWLPACLEALTAAFLHDVDWKGATDYFVPRPVILERTLSAVDGMGQSVPRGPFEIEFISPLALTGADPTSRPASLIIGLLPRLEGLARWHNVTLDLWTDPQAFKAAARSAAYRWHDVVPVAWWRGSRRQDQRIWMQGIVGTLTIEPGAQCSDWLAPVLELGETCHLGADIAFGCGRYMLRRD